MKITGYGSIGGPGPTRKREGTQGASSFADALAAAEAGETSAGAEIAAPASIGNLLALQEISEEEARRHKLVQRGNNLLDALEKLRRQLLIGTLPPQTLQALTQALAEQKQTVNDPQLMALMEDIELRAAVELAKFQMSGSRNQGTEIPI